MIYAASTYSKTLSNNTHCSVSDQSSFTGKALRECFDSDFSATNTTIQNEEKQPLDTSERGTMTARR